MRVCVDTVLGPVVVTLLAGPPSFESPPKLYTVSPLHNHSVHHDKTKHRKDGYTSSLIDYGVL